jgi:DNA repair protein RadC
MAAEIFASQSVGSLEVECFWVAALDTGRKLIAVTRVAQGGLSRVDVVIRDVLVPLVRARAHAAYIAHNHPSGDPRWSDSDVRLTQRVVAAATGLGIEIVDHLILAPTGAFVSMEEEDAL